MMGNHKRNKTFPKNFVKQISSTHAPKSVWISPLKVAQYCYYSKATVNRFTIFNLFKQELILWLNHYEIFVFNRIAKLASFMKASWMYCCHAALWNVRVQTKILDSLSVWKLTNNLLPRSTTKNSYSSELLNQLSFQKFHKRIAALQQNKKFVFKQNTNPSFSWKLHKWIAATQHYEIFVFKRITNLASLTKAN